MVVIRLKIIHGIVVHGNWKLALAWSHHGLLPFAWNLHHVIAGKEIAGNFRRWRRWWRGDGTLTEVAVVKMRWWWIWIVHLGNANTAPALLVMRIIVIVREVHFWISKRKRDLKVFETGLKLGLEFEKGLDVFEE